MWIWLSTLIGKVTGEAIKTGVDTRKSFVETKKAKLEISKLEDEQLERQSLITPASMDDVKKFDHNYQRIIKNVRTHDEEPPLFHRRKPQEWKSNPLGCKTACSDKCFPTPIAGLAMKFLGVTVRPSRKSASLIQCGFLKCRACGGVLQLIAEARKFDCVRSGFSA